MRLPVFLFSVFFLLSVVMSGRRRYPDTQACIRRDGYCKMNCNETEAVLESDLGTCADGKKRCCRPQDLVIHGIYMSQDMTVAGRTDCFEKGLDKSYEEEDKNGCSKHKGSIVPITSCLSRMI